MHSLPIIFVLTNKLTYILQKSYFQHSRLYATSHMRVLLRSKIAFFNNWGMEFLVTQLYDTDPCVASEAADVLDEACEDEANLQYLVQLRPVLLHLGGKGIRLLTRFVSVERGFSYLTSLGYLQMLLDKWRQHYRLEYVRWVDELLAESLTTYTKPANDEGYVRRSNKKQIVKDVFLPPHLYGELVQKKNGFKVLQKTNDIEECVRTIRNLEPDSRDNICKIKAALWALGHCGSSNWGITLLMEEDVIPDIVRMAEESDNFAIRGTCYYVLGLAAKTRQGAEILNDLEWVSIRHIGNEEWPVVESKDLEIPAMMWASPTPSPTYSAFNLGKISESNDNGIYFGEETKKATDSSYDELSGIYIGEDKTTSKKAAKEERAEPGGILARWYADAERRRKIATRESGLYDDTSGVYIGNENAPQKSFLDQEGFVPGGIMAKLYQDGGSGKSKESKHRRNLSDGNFSSSTGVLNKAVNEMDAKRRTYSNVDHIESLNVEFSVRGNSSKISRQDSGLVMNHVHSSSTTSEDSLGNDVNRETREGIDPSSSLARNKYDNSISELAVPTGHARTDSNVSSVSESSIDYQDASSMSYGSIVDLDEPPSYRTAVDTNRLRAAVGIDDRRLINPPPLRLTARSNDSVQNEDEGKLTPDYDPRRAILTRQRSISMTEKHRTKSPTLALIAENRSSSFHGSTEFSKIASSKRTSTDMSTSPHSTGMDDALSSSNSLAEVKILSDKTIVFRTGIEKDRSQSFDSAQVSDLRRDRLLVSSQISEPEMDSGAFKARSRTSSCEKAELARRLGLKSGDISQRGFGRSKSTSSGYGSDIYQRKKIINKNSLLGNTEHVTVSGDSNKNARSNSDVGNYTTMRDASGYVALSTLRRQHSLNKEALANTNNYNRPLFTAGPTMTDGSGMNPRDTLSSSTNSYEFRQLTSSMASASIGTEFLGLCLPLNLSTFFQVEPYNYQGSWPDHFVSDPRTVGVVTHPEELDGITDEHEPLRCLGCMYSKRTKSMSERRKSIDAIVDPEKLLYGNDATEKSSEESISPCYASSATCSVQGNEEEMGTKNMDESSHRGRVQIRKEVLRLVVKLSSAVGSKSHQEGLSQFKRRFPHIFQDLCMFCEVIDLMSVYQFRLVIRRFLIHTLFDDVLFAEINERADAIAHGAGPSISKAN